MTCLAPSCGRAIHARGLCGTHYKQARAGRSLSPIRVYATGPELVEDACWLLDAGEHPVHVAARLGVSLAALDHALRRAGRGRPAVSGEASAARRASTYEAAVDVAVA